MACTLKPLDAECFRDYLLTLRVLNRPDEKHDSYIMDSGNLVVGPEFKERIGDEKFRKGLRGLVEGRVNTYIKAHSSDGLKFLPDCVITPQLHESLRLASLGKEENDRLNDRNFVFTIETRLGLPITGNRDKLLANYRLNYWTGDDIVLLLNRQVRVAARSGKRDVVLELIKKRNDKSAWPKHARPSVCQASFDHDLAYGLLCNGSDDMLDLLPPKYLFSGFNLFFIDAVITSGRPDVIKRLMTDFLEAGKKFDDTIYSVVVCFIERALISGTIPMFRFVYEQLKSLVDLGSVLTAKERPPFDFFRAAAESGRKVMFECAISIFKPIYALRPDWPPLAQYIKNSGHRGLIRWGTFILGFNGLTHNDLVHIAAKGNDELFYYYYIVTKHDLVMEDAPEDILLTGNHSIASEIENLFAENYLYDGDNLRRLFVKAGTVKALKYFMRSCFRCTGKHCTHDTESSEDETDGLAKNDQVQDDE